MVSIGLCATFAQRGLAVQPFKKGPDYIDPSWLTAASRVPCRNLDLYLMSNETVTNSFDKTIRGKDLALIEGAMGLYDGLDLEGSNSTAELSRLLQAPVVLVVNTARMTRSVAAMIAGYQHFEPDVNVAGVILNNVSGARHERMLAASIEQYCGIPVLGRLPRDESLNVTQRYLGLAPYGEEEHTAYIIERIRETIEANVDLDAVLRLAQSASPVSHPNIAYPHRKEKVARIGVMLDCAFTFYYPENLEALSDAGAELAYIDSIKADRLPDVDGLYIGGGFPELFAGQIEANSSLRANIKQAAEDGLPVYAECAGLMYLCRSIKSAGQRHEMVGVFPFDAEMRSRPRGHGYSEVAVSAMNPFFPLGAKLRGHEFHHSELVGLGNVKPAYKVLRGSGIDGANDGLVYKNVLAAYTHLHALTVPQWAPNFVALAAKRARRSPLNHANRDSAQSTI